MTAPLVPDCPPPDRFHGQFTARHLLYDAAVMSRSLFLAKWQDFASRNPARFRRFVAAALASGFEEANTNLQLFINDIKQ